MVLVDIQSVTAEIRQGKKKKERRRKKQDKNIMSASTTQGVHKETTRQKYNVCICYAGQP